jgi:hypothetical protein
MCSPPSEWLGHTTDGVGCSGEERSAGVGEHVATGLIESAKVRPTPMIKTKRIVRPEQPVHAMSRARSTRQIGSGAGPLNHLPDEESDPSSIHDNVTRTSR